MVKMSEYFQKCGLGTIAFALIPLKLRLHEKLLTKMKFSIYLNKFDLIERDCDIYDTNSNLSILHENCK
jgi:hypothetical protein